MVKGDEKKREKRITCFKTVCFVLLAYVEESCHFIKFIEHPVCARHSARCQ